MCRYVCGLLPPARQAHLRSAGSLGYDAFEELVALGDVPAYVVVTRDQESYCFKGGMIRDKDGSGVLREVVERHVMNAPVRLSMRYRREPLPDYSFQDHARFPITLSHHALSRRGIISPISCKAIGWKTLCWQWIRYDCSSCSDGGKRGSLPHGLLSELPNVRSADFCGGDDLVRLPGGLLSLCPRLACVITKSWANVTTIESCVLTQNPLLKYLDLSPLENVTFIGDCFLSGCSGLEFVNL